MDWRNPDYVEIITERVRRLRYIRENPSTLPDLKSYYRDHIADFISDFGVTFDPRNAERGLPTVIPFVLFPKQREWIDWVVKHWRTQTPGLCEKSRDMGISWLATATACSLCLFHRGLAIGFGSRVTDLVDKIGTMKPLLPKARMFMECLPREFRGGYRPERDAPFMRLNFPETGSLIMGEGGDQIGRGDRASIYMVDEASYLERPELIEQSLSQTTNCRIDMSSVAGMNNVFARKRHEGKVDVFIFDWRDDPRKDQFWYDALSLPSDEFVQRPDGTKIFGKALDPVTIAQEVDRDYSASVTGIVIPAAWVKSAIGARDKLGMAPSGLRGMSLDVADEGTDKNATAEIHGIQVDELDEWSGVGGDIFATVERAFAKCDEKGYRGFRYDADGLGAGVRGDARIINERRAMSKQRPLLVVPFRGSEDVVEPEGIVEGTLGSVEDKGRTNKDYFANRKAQGWWTLRRRFQKTHRWIAEGKPCNPNDLISLNPNMRLLFRLVAELSQPTYTQNPVGKMVINKIPQSMKSPNLGDAVMQRYAQVEPPALNITPEVVQAIHRAGRRRGAR